MASLNHALMAYDDRPIGIFDSGIGGVSVLNCFLQRFPNENYIYVGDTARLPYGNKSPETIQKYCEQILNFLVSQDVKLIVVACNTASTQINHKTYKDIPVIEMISAGTKQLFATTRTPSSQTLLLATRSTIRSNAYQEKIKSHDASINLQCIPCPLFVPLVEEGLLDHPLTYQSIELYLNSANVDWKSLESVILGCTHYPFLKQSLQKYFIDHQISNLRFIDCGIGAVDDFEHNPKIMRNIGSNGSLKVFLTDQSEYFQVILQRLVHIQAGDIQTVHL